MSSTSSKQIEQSISKNSHTPCSPLSKWSYFGYQSYLVMGLTSRSCSGMSPRKHSPQTTYADKSINRHGICLSADATAILHNKCTSGRSLALLENIRANSAILVLVVGSISSGRLGSNTLALLRRTADFLLRIRFSSPKILLRFRLSSSSFDGNSSSSSSWPFPCWALPLAKLFLRLVRYRQSNWVQTYSELQLRCTSI